MRLALFQPDIPQNLGAAMRLTAALGVGLDVIEPCGFPWGDAGVRRAAMDYAPIAEVKRYSGWAQFHAGHTPGRLVLLTTRGARPLHQFAFRPTDTLLLGRESVGVPDDVHQSADARVVIPLAAGARSLNVVTAAAITLAEALRQTGDFPTPDE